MVKAFGESGLTLLVTLGIVFVLTPGSVDGKLAVHEPASDVPMHPGGRELIDEESVEAVDVAVLKVGPHLSDLLFDFGDGAINCAEDGDLPVVIVGRFTIEVGPVFLRTLPKFAKRFDRDASDIVAEFFGFFGSDGVDLAFGEDFVFKVRYILLFTHFGSLFLPPLTPEVLVATLV